MSNIYHIKFDQDGYIVDMSKFPASAEYVAIDIGATQIPPKIMRGYYKWNGSIVVDAVKEEIVDAELAALSQE